MNLTYTSMAVVVISFMIALISIPYIIKWAHRSGKLTQRNHRSSHKLPTPSLGGVGILLGMAVLIPFLDMTLPMAATCFGVLLLFATGLIDDLTEIKAKTKLLVQVACALLIYFSGLRIENLHGILGVYEIPGLVSFTLTVLFIVGVTNAFNLMDGINGLAGIMAIINSALFGVIFYLNGQSNFALLAFALCGGVLGFLRFNIPKAKIFMGDSGSLFIGLLMGVFVIQTFQTNTYNELSISVALVPMFIPIFDTIRLFATRVMDRKSPMEADKNHLHHLVIKATSNHTHATFLIVTLHVLLLGFVMMVSYFGGELLLNTLITILLGGVVAFLGLFVFMEVYMKLKRLRAHLKLLLGNNRLLEKL